MRKRLLLSATFAAVGLAAAIPIADRMGISAVTALVFCAAVGALVGYLVSIFLDLFLTNSSETE
jgi:Na+/glutamate symporter